MGKIPIKSFLILVLLLFFPPGALSEEIYEYERMWPALEQPWYFDLPEGIAVDNGGSIYVADTNHCVQKFTSDGQFITKWGSKGSGDGQFTFPSGMAVDSSGNVYVADVWNNRIQKFKSNGEFITKWGSMGIGHGQFKSPHAIAIDSKDNVFVAEVYNYRIQKFKSNGEFITKWGSQGNGDGQFNYPEGIAIDSSGNVYVADRYNQRIQKFTSDGQFVTEWKGGEDDQFQNPSGIAVDSNDDVYINDSYGIHKFTSEGKFITKVAISCWGYIAIASTGNIYVADFNSSCIRKFTLDGQFITKWGSGNNGDGQFDDPHGIAIDSAGVIHVADGRNNRVQKFKSDGQFIAKWGSFGIRDGEFYNPGRITIDGNGNVYVVDTWNYRIQKFTLDGQFITKWGSQGSGDGQFDFHIYPSGGIAVDSRGDVYVSDTYNYRLQKFTSDGQFITKWGSQGSGDGQFNLPQGIAIDSSSNVYVGDWLNFRIQKFTSDGQFITKWGSQGSGDGQFDFPQGIVIDSNDNVYVTEGYNCRIQKFTSDGKFIIKWGSCGNSVGEFGLMVDGIGVSSDGRVYVSDTGNNRIQVFKKASSAPSGKAMKGILVAGSGPFEGNNLWDATEMNANLAYRVLAYQGYTNDTIYYLSSDRNLDLNGDGIPDVEGDATNSNLQYAITQWAKDAESLVVYLIGHGGDGTFRMSETEVLEAEALASWLNELQQTMPRLVTLVYDACESGSFVSKLATPSGKQRITITSTLPGEPAYFLSQGALSFSYTFWSQIFGGAKIYDAYVVGKDVIGVAMGAGKSQNPEIDDNGNGIGNEKTDGDLASNTYIGKGFAIAGDIPSISAISPDQVLNGQTSATITVEVVSTGRITRVWAIVHSPDFSNNPDNPITDLPSFDFTWNEQNQRYEGTYNGFTVMGTYTVTVYAMNEAMIVSLPKTAKIEQVVSNQYTLTVTIAPSNAAGSVTKSPNKSIYTNGESVTLTATPNSGYSFSHWTGDASGGTNPITLTMNGNKTVTANFTQANVPDILVTPLTYDFGNVKVKKSKSGSFKVQNNGEANLTIAALIIGPDASMFTLAGGGGNKTIKPGKFSTIKVTFKPTSTGSKQATLRITSNDPDTSIIDIALSGTGQ